MKTNLYIVKTLLAASKNKVFGAANKVFIVKNNLCVANNKVFAMKERFFVAKILLFRTFGLPAACYSAPDSP